MAKRGRVVYRTPATGGCRRRARRRYSVSESDEDDKEYVVGEEESDSSVESLVASSDDDDFVINTGNDGNDDDDEEEEDHDFAPSRSNISNVWSRKARKVAFDDDYVEDEKELALAPITKRKRTARSRRKKSSASSEDDKDFNPDDVEFDEEEVVEIVKNPQRKKNSSRPWARPPKNRRRKAPKQKKAVKKRRVITDPRSDDDDDEDFVVNNDEFVVKDRVSVNKIRKDRCRSSKKKRIVGRKRFAIYSDDEDLDFVVDSLDEEWEEEKTIHRKNTKRKRSLVMEDSEQELKDSESEFDLSVSDEDVRESVIPKRKIQKRARINRKKSCSAADSDSSDFDYEISEGELRDLQIPKPKAPKPLQLPKRSIIKGKEKEVEDLGKQLCGICLSEEHKTTVQGILDCCSHYYCYQCIMEWSKVESRCPVCKRRFSTISKMERTDLGFGLRKQVIKVPKRDQVYQPSEEEMRGYIDPYENVVCIVCQQGGDDGVMLLCDICDSSAHTYCVGLGTEVPEGNWYCEACRLADDGLVHTQVQDSGSGHLVANTSNSLFADLETEDLSFNLRRSVNAPHLILSPGDPGHCFSHGFDLNAPPRDSLEEDLSTPLQQFSAAGALTLSGRRAIHQRIRFILSSRGSRSRELLSTSNENGINNTSLAEPGIEASYHAPRNVGVHSRFRLSSCMHRDDDNFRRVDGAKDYVQSSVKDR